MLQGILALGLFVCLFLTCVTCHADLYIKSQMAVCRVGGAGAAAGVLGRPRVTGDESGALARASAAGGPDSRAGESSL